MRPGVLAIGLVLVPLVGAAPPSGGGDGLAGYLLRATAAPVVVHLDDPRLPGVSRPSGELNLSYTSVSLDTGPTARALASSLWPGATIGEALPALVPGAPTYPVRAEARTPEGPPESDLRAGPGTGMYAVADRERTAAVAEVVGAAVPDLVEMRGASSTSTARVAGRLATAEARSSLERVRAIAGLVVVEGVDSMSRATTDGRGSSTDGGSSVARLIVAGHEVDVDQATEDVAELEDLGISVTWDLRTVEGEGADATYAQVGVQIRIDTAPLRRALDAVPVEPLVAQLPDDVVVRLRPLLDLAPVITLSVGGSSVRAAGSRPMPVAAPSLSDPPLAPARPASGSSPVIAPHLDAPPPDPVPDLVADAPPGQAVLVAAPVAKQPVPAPLGTTSSTGPTGVPPGLVAAVALGALFTAAGLVRVRERAFAPPVVSCRGDEVAP